jgi:uncharacterized protein DUF4230
MLFSASVLVALLAFTLGGLVVWLITSKLRRLLPRFREDRLLVQTVVERVRAVGKLVGLEVYAKEIATATTGWAWMPPLLLSQARLAMIFNFEKQYTVDFSGVGPDDVTELSPGRFRIVLPPVQGQLHLLDITPYDIQSARVLGLLDVVSMTADRQKDLMRKAQQQAAELYDTNDARYLAAARISIERHLRSLMDLFGVEVEVQWSTSAATFSHVPAPAPVASQPVQGPAGTIARLPALAAAG